VKKVYRINTTELKPTPMLYVLVYFDLSLIILEELEIYYYVFEDQEMFYCSKRKNNKFEYNVLIICRYLNLQNKIRGKFLQKIENSQVVTIKF
jgi:hypothetical protein